VRSPIRCAIVGYGSGFEFGRAHAQWMCGVPDLKLVAICDPDLSRTAKARSDLSGIETFDDLAQMLHGAEVDLVTIVTPHNTHADLTIQCLRAGKHVIVDKPMCISVVEADAMMAEAVRNGVTLAVFHNRRRDGNYRLIRKLVGEGAIGQVFHIELRAGQFGSPGEEWRSNKRVAGGALYDWGAHATDWLLTLVPGQVVGVSGHFHKLRWHGASIADQARALVRFANGTVADVSLSYIDAAPGPLWRILGTEGALVDTGQAALAGYFPEYRFTCQSEGTLLLIHVRDGELVEEEVRYLPSTWGEYYADIAAHLLRGGPIPVAAQAGRRVIALLEAAEKSAQERREIPVGI